MAKCRNCTWVADFLDDDYRGFCSGLTTKPPKDSPKEDVVCLCFVESKKEKAKYFLKPGEALSIATVLVGSFEAWAKKNRVELK